MTNATVNFPPLEGVGGGNMFLGRFPHILPAIRHELDQHLCQWRA